MRLAEQRTPFGHPVFLQHRAEDAFDVLVLEDTEVLAQTGTPQRRVHLHAVQHLVFVVLPEFKPGILYNHYFTFNVGFVIVSKLDLRKHIVTIVRLSSQHELNRLWH